MEITAEMVERGAKALRRNIISPRWEQISEAQKEMFRKEARAVLNEALNSTEAKR